MGEKGRERVERGREIMMQIEGERERERVIRNM